MSKEKRVVEARQKALNQIVKDETLMQRLLAKLRARIVEATPAAIREACNLEYELTADMVACSIMGEALGLSDFCDCDCSDYFETVEGTSEITTVGHLPACRLYREDDALSTV